MKKLFRPSRQSALHYLQPIYSLRPAFIPKPLASAAIGFGLALMPVAANAAPLQGWQVNPTTGQVTFIVPDGVEPRYFIMAQPARIVIDIPDTQIGDLPLDQSYSDGPVRRVTLEQNQPKLLRATLEMSPKAKFSRGQVRLENNGDGTDGTNTRWSVTPLIVGATTAAPAQNKPIPAPTSTPQVSPAKPSTDQAPQTPAPKLEPARPETPPSKPSLPAPKPAEFPPGIQPVEPPSTTPIAPAKPPSPVVKSPLPMAASIPPARNFDPKSAPIATSSTPPGVIGQPIAAMPAPMPADVPVMNFPQSLPTATAPARTPQPPITVPPLASVRKLDVPSDSLPSTSQSSSVPPAPSTSSREITVDRPTLPETPRSATPSMGVPALPDIPRSSSKTAMGVPAMPDLPRSPGPLATTAITYGSSPTIYNTVPSPYGGLPANQGQLFAIAPTNPQPQGSPAPGTMAFGQPLPMATYGTGQLPNQPGTVGSVATGSTMGSTTVTALDNLSTGGVVVPVGTSLNLRYGGTQTLKLANGAPRQEVLVLQTAVIDRFGKTIIPAGSTVLGQFETDGSGSRFVTQGLSFYGKNLAMNAQSVSLGGGRKVSNNKLLQNSGIGAVAGAILGGISGGNVIGGAAAGAAITYAIAPKTATIEPGQLVEVRLTQDLLAAR